MIEELEQKWIAIIITVVTIAWWLWRRSKNLPPGPMGLPVLGYFPFLALDNTHEHFLKLSKIYGDVFCFRTVGGHLIVILNGAKVIKDVLVNKFEEFDRRPIGSNLVSWFSDGLGIAQEDGPGWSDHRRFFLQKARELGVGKLEVEDIIQDEVNTMVKAMHQDGKDVKFNISCATSNVISHLLFRKKLNREGVLREMFDVMREFVQGFTGNHHYLVGLPYDLMMTIRPSMWRWHRQRNQVRRYTDDMVKEVQSSYDPDISRSYVDSYILHQGQLKEKSAIGTFTHDRLLANSLNLFFEGTESVSSAIYSLLSELSKYPEVQKTVQKELDNVIGRERLPSWGDRTSLPYFDATIQELFRMGAPFLVSTMYCNEKETTINGYRIPKRSIVVANYYSIHFDPENFPDPQVFNPDRFLSNRKRIKKEGPYPFGIGKRSCIGEALAQVEVFVIVGSILQNFNVLPLDGITVVPRDGIKQED